MALTKINFYLGFLLIYAMIISGSVAFMSYQVSTDIAYKSDNDDFVINYLGFSRNVANITQLSEADAKEIKEQSIISEDNTTGESSVTDNLATINFYSSRISKIGSYLQLVYNAPSFFVYSLGLPYEDVRHLINIFSVVLFISVVVLLIKQIRGS